MSVTINSDMNITITPLSKQNLKEAAGFISRSSAFSGLTFGWDSGRFNDWYYGSSNLRFLIDNPLWFWQNCLLVMAEEQLAALVISEYGKSDFAIITPKKEPELINNILTELETTWGLSRKSLYTEINRESRWLIEILKQHGYKPGDDPIDGHEWEYDLTAPLREVKLPRGYSISDGASQSAEIAQGVTEVIRDAFGAEWYAPEVLKGIAGGPAYNPRLDLVVKNEEGRVAAYCRGYADPRSEISSIDPVCCHSDFRRKGLTKALINMCFNRLAQTGCKTAVIGSAPIPEPSTYLYQSLNPEVRRDFVCYSKEFGKNNT